MEQILKQTLQKVFEEKNQPTEKDRIDALENAIADLAIMMMEVSE